MNLTIIKLTDEQREALFPTKKAPEAMNKTMVVGLSVLLCLYLAFGLMGCSQNSNELPPGWKYIGCTVGDPPTSCATFNGETYKKCDPREDTPSCPRNPRPME